MSDIVDIRFHWATYYRKQNVAYVAYAGAHVEVAESAIYAGCAEIGDEYATDDATFECDCEAIANAASEEVKNDVQGAFADAVKSSVDDVEDDVAGDGTAALDDHDVAAALDGRDVVAALDDHDVAASDNSCFASHDLHTQLAVPVYDNHDVTCDNCGDSLDHHKFAHCILDDACY